MRIGWAVIGGLAALGLVAVFALGDPWGLGDLATEPERSEPDPTAKPRMPEPTHAPTGNADGSREDGVRGNANGNAPIERVDLGSRADRERPKLLTPLAPASLDEFEVGARGAVAEVLRTFVRSEDSPLAELAPVAGLIVAEVEELGSDWAAVRIRAEAPGLGLTTGQAARVRLVPDSSAGVLARERGLEGKAELEVGEVRVMLVVAQVGGLGWVAGGRRRGE